MNNTIQKCDCGALGCDRYIILPYTKNYTLTQLQELRDDLNKFLAKIAEGHFLSNGYVENTILN